MISQCRVVQALALVVLLHSVAWSEVIRVDWAGVGDYATLQEGIAAAASGDTVLVSPGTYSGHMNRNLDFAGVNMKLISTSGSSDTVIDCEFDGRALSVRNGESSETLVQGFTITRGLVRADTLDWLSGYGGGILCYASSPRFQDIIFMANSASSEPPDQGKGGGLYVGWSTTSLVDCRFEENTCFHGAGLTCHSSTVSLASCVFEHNRAARWGGAVYFHGGALTAANVDFTENEAEYGGAIKFRYLGSAHVLTDCFFLDNTASHWGGAVASYMAQPTFLDCGFLDNSSRYDGVAIGFSHNENGHVERCVFRQNTADQDGGVVSCYEASPTIRDCSFLANDCPGGGAVRCEAESSPSVVNAIIAENKAGSAVYCEDDTCFPVTSYSCIFANAAGDTLCGSYGNILYEDPLFCTATLPDWSLEDCSPCIGAGEGGTTIGAADAGCPCGDPTGIPSQQQLGLQLLACVPNPARGSVTLHFHAQHTQSHVAVSLYSAAGKLVRRLRAPHAGSGQGSVSWDCRDASGSRVAAGVYFAEISCGPDSDRGRFVFLR